MNISFTPSTLTITSLRLTVADIEDDPEGEVAEDGAIVDDGSDEEDVMFMGGGAAGRGFSASSINNSNVGGMHSVGGKGGSSEASSAGRFPLPNPNVDSTAWWAEVERSSARLRAPVRLGGGSGVPLGLGGRLGGGVGGASSPILSLGEWRGHLEATQGAGKTVSKLANPLFSSLRTLNGELVEALGSLAARETSLNTAYATVVKTQAEGAGKVSTLRAAVNGSQCRVTGLSAELAAIDEAMDEVKSALDERNNTMANSDPLIRIKAALSSLRSDLRDLDVQLGVLGHSVMQQRLQDKYKSHNQLKDAAAAVGRAAPP